MFFRNLTLFRYSEAMAESLADLDTPLEEKRLRACEKPARTVDARFRLSARPQRRGR